VSFVSHIWRDKFYALSTGNLLVFDLNTREHKFVILPTSGWAMASQIWKCRLHVTSPTDDGNNIVIYTLK
jgi:hypothetical protein